MTITVQRLLSEIWIPWHSIPKCIQSNSRPEKSAPRSVSHICFSMSQQKLDLFHFLLWWLWKGGWARSKDVTMETLSFPVRSYLRMKQMLFVTYWCMSRTLTKEATVGAHLKAVYKVSHCFQAELLFQPAQVFGVSLIGLCYSSTGSIYEAKHIIGPLKVLLKSWLRL